MSLSGDARFRGPCVVPRVYEIHSHVVTGAALSFLSYLFFLLNCPKALQMKEDSVIPSLLMIQRHDENLSSLRDIVFFFSRKPVYRNIKVGGNFSGKNTTPITLSPFHNDVPFQPLHEHTFYA